MMISQKNQDDKYLVFLQGMSFFGYHGVLPEERKQGQRFEVDAELFYSLDKIKLADNIDNTVDYVLVYQEIKTIVECQQYKLLETLADQLAIKILNKFPIDGVKVRVKKPEVEMPGPLDVVGVEVVRWSDEGKRWNKEDFFVLDNKSERAWTKAYIGMGSNLGDREAYLWQALGLLAADPCIKLLKISSFYETKPVGYQNQDNFLNAVIQLKTCQTVEGLMKILQKIEIRLGRERKIQWGPRTIDLDLLLFGCQSIQSSDLTVPHPRIYERDFVLVPLAEIEPRLVFPDGRSLNEVLDEISKKQRNLLSKWPSHVKM